MKLLKEQISLRLHEFRSSSSHIQNIEYSTCKDALVDCISILQLLAEYKFCDSYAKDKLNSILHKFLFVAPSVVLAIDACEYDDTSTLTFIDYEITRKAFIYTYREQYLKESKVALTGDYEYPRNQKYNKLEASINKLKATYEEVRNYIVTTALPDLLENQAPILYNEYNRKVMQLFGIDDFEYLHDYLKEPVYE